LKLKIVLFDWKRMPGICVLTINRACLGSRMIVDLISASLEISINSISSKNCWAVKLLKSNWNNSRIERVFRLIFIDIPFKLEINESVLKTKFVGCYRKHLVQMEPAVQELLVSHESKFLCRKYPFST